MHTPFFIPAPAGRLEVLPEAPDAQPAALAVICHPHPVYGGTLENKVVHTLAKTLLAHHIQTVRFNFRGAGNSEGHFAHGDGECEDLRAVVAWAQQQVVDIPLYLAGFSFGGYIALRMHAQLCAQRLILVAPAVRYCHDEECRLTEIPTLLLQGAQDDVVSPQSTAAWREAQAVSLDYRLLPETDHFFHGRLTLLKQALNEWLN